MAELVTITATEWRINNFRKSLFGLSIFSGNSSKTLFKLGHAWRLSTSFFIGTIRVGIKKLDKQPVQRDITLTISLLDSSRRGIDCDTENPVKTRFIKTGTSDFLVFVTDIPVVVPHDDVVVLRCEFAVDGISDKETALSRDIGSYLLPTFKLGLHADVTLTADGREFPAHKVILASRSPVFCAMFSQNLMETQLNRVDITDVSADVLEALLKYMYAGRVSDQADVGLYLELLAAADKYELAELKCTCAAIIGSNVCEENACQILEVAYLHNEVELVREAIEFVNKHSYNKSLKAEFLQLGKRHVELLAQAYDVTVSKRFDGWLCTDLDT